jgi:predicted short-subunit dehydrogenase-like oxidoreductase (DUF2520 family)
MTTIGELPSLAIVGAGRVGSTLSQTLHWRGYNVTAVYSRTPASAQRLADKLGTRAVSSAAEAVDLSGRAVVHTSGVTSMAALATAKVRGAMTGGLHPMLPIMDAELSPRMAFSVPWVAKSPDVTFGVEAEDGLLRTWLSAMVKALNGVALWLHPGQDRARYHAAGVIASNYLVTLFAEALGLLNSLETDASTDEAIIRQTLVHLVDSTLHNVKAVGAVQALTGPIARGDAGTIRRHLEALEQSDPELADLYRVLGRRTLRLAAARGLDADKQERIRQSLED